MKKSIIGVSVILMLGLACATRVNIASTHRDDIAAQAGILEIAARNLEGAVRARTGTPGEDTAADAVVRFHTTAESFAREARGGDLDKVDSRYERMIEAWVRVKHTFPDLHADALLRDSYSRVQQEWEKMERVSGYAGKRYQEKIEGN